MNIVADAELMERVVFAAVRARPDLERRYHRRFAAAHAEPPEQRDAAFSALHAEWFRDLGFDERLRALLREYPLLHTHVERLVLHEAPTRRTQGCELFGQAGDHSVVAAIHVATLLDDAAFQYWARHEFQHVEDMLDPAFAYDPADRPDGPTAAARNLVRDRYALLWSLSVDARLASRMTLPAGVLPRRQREFAAAFGLSERRADELFASTWAAFRHSRPTHAALLSRARAGASRDANESNPQPPAAPPPGAPCPLCAFPTFDWARPADLDAASAAQIQLDFPGWSPPDSLCGRCAELYRSQCRVPVRHA
ncbi:MAG: hypothetical protein CHACPFDD_03042 [Phycisphaerae bacterium]|nr:hypothetical protein [Phycisphaerae bacterium]